MSKNVFYLCDVCGQEIDASKPCHVAILATPGEYIPTYDFANRKHRYICQSCIPIPLPQKVAHKRREGSLLSALAETATQWIRNQT